ncbi:hypothetical protein G3N56_11310 [Desulfovibrio sulfodismutans]|uniref:Uncharacterized protein n=1 Tax=Desulfolutivibrio sulfodismutans TaxID=63561 RepID=A0A7K3NMB8_9BACT|nr:hypothetical protein [Desulfolutivibrio sulfodismutans]NDY57330.1 hypothetical protein [Desulfolutivibrio sulfodismutans]QLA11875.1 hypothetical protein GD606_06175 [Desulfolutivibrio sulfodismutans DSM 3696]QLA13534.1 hypothetical protein GD606_15310 [Desulfolutivibrio sulfodismutans DSM 3696]
MIDMFLHAPTRQALATDLAPLGLTVDGDLAYSSHRHNLMDLIETDDGGVTVALCCLDDALALAVQAAVFPAGTAIVSRPENAPVPAGGASENLETAKAVACAAIDAEAERRRLMVLTPGDGQTLEYQHTAHDAARADTAPDPLTPAAYPFLVAEQTALARVDVALTLRQVVDLVVYQRATWLAYGAAVKAARRGAKLAIDEAATPLDVAVVLAGVVWPELAEHL